MKRNYTIKKFKTIDKDNLIIGLLREFNELRDILHLAIQKDFDVDLLDFLLKKINNNIKEIEYIKNTKTKEELYL